MNEELQSANEELETSKERRSNCLMRVMRIGGTPFLEIGEAYGQLLELACTGQKGDADSMARTSAAPDTLDRRFSLFVEVTFHELVAAFQVETA